MKLFQQLVKGAGVLATCTLILWSCQKMSKPDLGDYPVDTNPPGGPLKFYVAFDGTTANASMNAVDSIRANFPSSNPLTSIDGVSGKAIKGESKKFITYAKPNDWALTAKSFTIAFWMRKNGQTKNNAGTNGPEFPFSFKSSNGHWSGGSFFLLLEGSNAACAVKMVVVDKNMADTWMTWEGGNTVAGLLDNNWHHLVFVYNAGTSTLTMYKDGVANALLRNWGSHGDINIDNGAISELRVGCGPGTSYNTDDWLSSTWKGDLDQFRMYGTALSAAEAKALYDSRL